MTSTEGCLKEAEASYRDLSKLPLLCFFIVKTGVAKATSHIAVKSSKKSNIRGGTTSKKREKDVVMRFMRAKNKNNKTVNAE